MVIQAPRVQVPATVAKGETFQVKALIPHAMETGLRYDNQGSIIPRKIINRFTCRYDDVVVFAADFHEAVAANPYVEFYIRAAGGGSLQFIWEEDGGGVFQLEHQLAVG
jgi:sulfur-oxidizing protein SoxZ